MTNGKFYLPVPRRSQPEWLLDVLILLPFLLGTLNGLLGLPYGIRYLLDAVWLMLTVCLLRFSGALDWTRVRPLVAWVLSYLVCTALVYGVQYQSALYYLWGLRNNFRFYIAFFAFALFLTPRGADRYDALFEKLFWLNAAVSAVQYALGFRGDHLGGLFGTESGANGYTNIFFLVVLSGAFVRYLEKKETGIRCAAKCVTAVILAAGAELKFFFVELPLLLCLAVLVTDFTWRKFWVILGGTAAVLAGAALLTVAFPQYEGWYRLKWMLETVTARRGYTSSGDLNRLTAIPKIDALWLKHRSQRFFGKGLGNCDTSSFSFLNTPFFRSYGHMHYSWISYAFQYLETGWVGLIFYWGFFLLVAVQAHRMEKHNPRVDRTRCRIAKILACFSLVLSVYNASLRAESAYMLYYALAAPFAAGNLRKEDACEYPVLGRNRVAQRSGKCEPGLSRPSAGNLSPAQKCQSVSVPGRGNGASSAL